MASKQFWEGTLNLLKCEFQGYGIYIKILEISNDVCSLVLIASIINDDEIEKSKQVNCLFSDQKNQSYEK